MRVLIISDIHANLTALEAVLAAAGEYEAVWCLGDLVGYGPDPNACIQRIRQLSGLVCILGNHDAAVLGRIDTDNFNPEARAAIEWTQNELTGSSQAFLDSLPDKVFVGDITLAHGSPRHPVWEYLLDNRTATHSFSHFDTDYCLVGHTHLPVTYFLQNGNSLARLMVPESNSSLTLNPRMIINPGSVGQPRDRDPRAAYSTYDTETHTIQFQRADYDVSAVQARMQEAGLPDRHIARLAGGW